MTARRAWIAFLAFGALGALVYLAAPAPLRGSCPLFNVLGLSPVVAILAGVRMHRPERPAPWYIAACALFLFWLGDLYTYSYGKAHRPGRPVPEPRGHPVPRLLPGADGQHAAVRPAPRRRP